MLSVNIFTIKFLNKVHPSMFPPSKFSLYGNRFLFHDSYKPHVRSLLDI